MLNNRASLKARGSEGSYLPVSIAFTAWRDTSRRWASSAWLQFRIARSTFSWFFTRSIVPWSCMPDPMSGDDDKMTGFADRVNRHGSALVKRHFCCRLPRATLDPAPALRQGLRQLLHLRKKAKRGRRGG